MNTRKLWRTGASVAALAMAASTAPIRVGIFKGVGSESRYWHSNTHTAGAALTALLANPDAANLGPNLVKATAGIVVTSFGVSDSTANITPIVKVPTTEQKAAFINALDTLDVVVFPNSIGLESLFTDPLQRHKLETFFRTRGVIGLRWTWQTGGSVGVTWGAWDSLPGNRAAGWIISAEGTLRRDTSTTQDPATRFLNRGLPDTARILEEWVSFTHPPAVLRAIPGLKVTVILDSASLPQSAAVQQAMHANQPYGWYRELPEGGRFFYTGLGYRSELFTGAAVIDSLGDTVRPASHFLRRQLYNAVLWAANVDSNGVVAVRGSASGKALTFTDAARVTFSGPVLAVSILHDQTHTVEVRSLDGRLAALRRGAGRMDHRIEGLRPGVYTVAVTAGGRRVARLVTTP